MGFAWLLCKLLSRVIMAQRCPLGVATCRTLQHCGCRVCVWQGVPALHLVAKGGDVDVAEHFLTQGIPLDTKNGQVRLCITT